MYSRRGPLSAALCPQMPSFMQSAINCYAQTMSCPRHFRPDTVIIIHAIQCALSGPAVSFDCLCGQLFSMAEKLHWLTKSCWGWRAIKTEEFVCYLEKPLKWQMLEVEHGISCMLFTNTRQETMRSTHWVHHEDASSQQMFCCTFGRANIEACKRLYENRKEQSLQRTEVQCSYNTY